MLENIIVYLESLTNLAPAVQKFGATFVFNTNLFSLILPSSPNNIVLVTPYAGESVNTRSQVCSPNLQLMIRHATSKVGYDTANALIYELHKNTTILHGTCLAKNSVPNILPLDDVGRSIFTINFQFLTTY